jgi:hypothetical protein
MSAIVEELVHVVRAGKPTSEQEIRDLPLVEHREIEEHRANHERDSPYETLIRADCGCSEPDCARDSHQCAPSRS